MTEDGQSLGRRLLPLAADGCAVALYLYFFPLLTATLQEKKPANGALIGVAYLVFCLSVYVMRKLDATSRQSLSSLRSTLAFLGVCYGFLLTFMIGDTTGILDNPDALDLDLDSLATSLAMLLGVILYFGLIFLYPAVLLRNLKPAHRASRSTRILGRGFSLLGINLMIVLTAAHLEVYFSDAEAVGPLTWGAELLVFLCVFAFILIFYAPPRLLYLLNNPGWAGTLAFLLQTAFYSWRLLTGANG